MVTGLAYRLPRTVPGPTEQWNLFSVLQSMLGTSPTSTGTLPSTRSRYQQTPSGALTSGEPIPTRHNTYGKISLWVFCTHSLTLHSLIDDKAKAWFYLGWLHIFSTTFYPRGEKHLGVAKSNPGKLAPPADSLSITPVHHDLTNQ